MFFAYPIHSHSQVRVPKASTGLTSTSLTRLPTAARAFVRGKSGNSPFLPGGLDNLTQSRDGKGEDLSGISENATEGHQRWLTVAPGLSRGLRLPGMADIDNKSVEGGGVDGIFASSTLDTVSQSATEIVRHFHYDDNVTGNIKYSCIWICIYGSAPKPSCQPGRSSATTSVYREWRHR